MACLNCGKVFMRRRFCDLGRLSISPQLIVLPCMPWTLQNNREFVKMPRKASRQIHSKASSHSVSFSDVLISSNYKIAPRTAIPKFLKNLTLRSFSSHPYDPKKDAYIQDILREFGRDFSVEAVSGNDDANGGMGDTKSDSTGNSMSNVDEAAESPRDDGTSSSSSSDSSSSDSDSEVSHHEMTDSLITDEKMHDGMLEVDVSRSTYQEEIVADERMNEDILAEYEDIDEYSEGEEEFEEIYERVHVIPLERGETGVFNIDELVAVLHDENAIDLCVIAVPKLLNFVDYMVIASGRSVRHIRAMAEYIKWLHKRKKSKRDPYLKIEGLDAKDWVALDLGNIALHLFMPETREIYDLESLWAIGGEYDDRPTQQDDPYAFLFDQSQQTMEVNASSQEESVTVDMPQQAGSDISYEMHSDQWHQAKPVDVSNDSNIDR